MMADVMRQWALEVVVLATILVLGTDLFALRIVALTTTFVVACFGVGLIYGVLLALAYPKCPGCGGRHAPHDVEGGGGEG